MENQINNEEKIFFQENNVLVSQSRLVIEDKTYVLRNISSVSTASNHWIKKPSKVLYKILIGLALLLLYNQYKVISLYKQQNTDIPNFCYIMIVIYIAVFIFAVYKINRLKPQYFYNYYVRISSNSGTSDVLSSSDKQYIQKVVEALNQAIIYRG